jgi:hypothetical protein
MNENETISRKKNTPGLWEHHISHEATQLMQWQENAFQAALEKLQKHHGSPDTVMRIGEAFGRGVYAQEMKGKSPDQTIPEWIKEIQKDICTPLGTEFTFTKISHDLATTFVNRNPLAHRPEESIAAELFHFGVMRGLFLSAFPNGELLINVLDDNEKPEFIFKTFASGKDRLERENILRTLTELNKKDGA